MKIYSDNITKYNAHVLKLDKALSRYAGIRLLVFVVSISMLITLFTFKLFTAFFILIPISILCFGWVLKQHDQIASLKNHTLVLKNINESEILRDASHLESFETGDQFTDQNHPYTSDLDIFGQHSIFQLVNRTTTESAKIRLAEWLSAPASLTELLDRQTAIKALAEKLQWRQEFQASGQPFQNKNSDYSKLLDWVEKPVSLFKNRTVYIAFAITFPILLFLNAYFFYANLDTQHRFIYLAFIILILLINYIILKKVSPHAEAIVETSTEQLNTLRGYRALISKIESEQFQSKKLETLQSVLINSKYSAGHEINSICKLLDFSHQRPINKIPIGGNYIYPLLNSFLLLDIYLILGTEQWKLKNKAFLKLWAEVVSEFEVINSFAGFYYSNPAYIFPEITDQPNTIHFDELGHPLIAANGRVCNNYHSSGHGHMVIITGSNMGGKSTFLRTVGINLVLALAGAPCCAKHGQVAQLNIFTSMRTQDNLSQGVSSFYAELHRIEKMLKQIEQSPNVFFLLDEMFKGTNSKDRHRGGFSLINQLSTLQTSGIIATHDIELAKLAGYKKLVTNYSFNSEIKNNEMLFSYKLDPFICTDFNASALMKRSGINILSDIPHIPTA